MALRSLSYVLFVAISVKIVDNQCTDTTSNVSISLSEHTLCPSKPVTARCTVKKPADREENFLVWEYTSPDGMKFECAVLCHQTDVVCNFGEVKGVDCTCDETEITSEATIYPACMSGVNLSCSNGGIEQKVSFSVKDLKMPSLSLMNESVTKVDDDYNVTVIWSKDDCTSHDIQYVLSVTSPEIMNYPTNLTQMNLTLSEGIEYTLTVTATLCGESVTSNKLPLKFGGPSPVMPMPTDSSDSVAPIVGGSLAGVVLFIGSILLCGLIIVWCCRKKPSRVDRPGVELEEAEVDGPELHDNIEPLDIPGVELEETERNKISIRREEVEVEKRSGVGGLSVDDQYMYYSFTENEDKNFLRKCEHNGNFVCDVSLPEFVRGIGKDNNGFLYVLCSSTNSKVLKFDKELNPVRKTNKTCAEHFGMAYGILVTDEHVFVCARGNQKVCILDLDLNLQYLLKLDFNPIGITKLNDKYFVTTKAAIGILDLDIENMKFRVKMKTVLSTEQIKRGIALRGICSDNQYLYVTERDDKNGGRVLCLHYQENQLILKYVCRNSCQDCKSKKCCPIVIAHHNGTIIYSQGSWERKFHILRLAYDGTTATSELIIDVV